MNMQRRYIDWVEVNRLCSIIAGKMIADGTSIGCILAVARGGVVPATMIADMLSVGDLAMIRTRHYDDGMNIADHVDITFITPLEEIQSRVDRCRREGKIMLIVDDIADTGLTMRAIAEILKGYDWSDCVKIATLYMKPRSLFKPDYYADICSNDEWIVFPWEHHANAATTTTTNIH